MAHFKFTGDEERTFDRGFGRAPVTVQTGDLFYFAGPVGMQHLSPDLVAQDADTRRQVQLLQEQVNLANARDFAAGTPKSGGI